MVPEDWNGSYTPVKYFLISYRAYCDSYTAVMRLSEMSEEQTVVLPNWRIFWIGACTLLRTSIDLFQVDIRSCLNEKIRYELKNEWNYIKINRGIRYIGISSKESAIILYTNINGLCMKNG
jgi:hypothetical protein